MGHARRSSEAGRESGVPSRCSLDYPVSAGIWWRRASEQRQGIMRHALATNLEVQVIGRGMSGAPDGADERSSFHAVSRLDEIGAVMRIDRDQSVRVGDLDDASIR